MLTIRITLDVKTHLHEEAWKMAVESYPLRENQRDKFIVIEQNLGRFEVEVTETTVHVRGPL